MMRNESCQTKRELIQAIKHYHVQNDNLMEEVDETMLNGQNVEEEDGDVENEMDDERERDDEIIINETLRGGVAEPQSVVALRLRLALAQEQ